MARDIYAYREVALELVTDPRSGVLRIAPMAGQAFAPTLAVQCAQRLRTDYPAGTRFLVSAKLTDRLGGTPYLYVYHGDPVTLLTASEARKFLQAFRRGRI